MQKRFLDVSHEALIRGWPRLRRWLDEDRTGLRLLRRITDAAEEWERSDRDDDLLFRGMRLVQAQEWRTSHEAELNPLDREFLDASIVLKQRLEALERRRQELEEQERRREELERLHKAESDRVKLLLRQRNFGVVLVVLGVIVLIALLALGYLINEKRKAWQQTASQLNRERQTLIEKGKTLRESAKAALVNPNDPIRNVTALRNLALALNLDRQDVQAAKMTRNLLLEHVWCPPAASEVRYRLDTLLAAIFAPGGNKELFAVAGNGQLLFWNGRELLSVKTLFEKPKPTPHEVVEPGFASFSPNGQWLFVIAPTLVSTGVEAPYTAHELCKVQTWRWSMPNRTYEPAGEDLEFRRLRGSHMISFAWSPESDRVVLINTLQNEAECASFEIKGGTFQQLVEQSKKLNSMKVVALAFAAYRSGIAAVSVDPARPVLRNVSFIGADDLETIPGFLVGRNWLQLSEGFQPNDVAFGPGNDQLTLTSFSGVRILEFRDENVIAIPPPTFRDQLMRIVVGPGDFATRLVARTLYGRVEIAKGTRMQDPAEPAVFGGSTGIAQFSSDGKRLLILSGGLWNVFDRMRLIDVSPLYRTQEAVPKAFEAKPAPPWLSDIASAVSALDTTGDGALVTLEAVRQRYPGSKAGDPYEAVWNRFFPEPRTGH